MAFAGRSPPLEKPMLINILRRGRIEGLAGPGRSCAVILRARPGLSEAVFVNAFAPVITFIPSVLAAYSARAASAPMPPTMAIER